MSSDFQIHCPCLLYTSAPHIMKTDVKEKDNTYEVAIDLPGFKKDEIQIQLENGYVTVSAAKGLDKDEKDKEGKYIRRERYACLLYTSSFFNMSEMVVCDHSFFSFSILRRSANFSCTPSFIISFR